MRYWSRTAFAVTTLVTAALLVPALPVEAAAPAPTVRQLAGAPTNPLSSPNAIAIEDRSLFLVDANAVERFDLDTSAFSTVAGNRGQEGSTDGVGSAARFREPHGIATD